MQNLTQLLTTENEFIYNIITYPLALIEMMLISYICISLFKANTSNLSSKNYIIFLTLATLFSATIRIFLTIPFNFVFNFVINTILIIFLLKLSVFKSILAHCIFLIFNVIAEYIIFIFLSQSNIISLELAQSIPLYKALSCLSIYGIVFVFIRITQLLKGNLNLSDDTTSKEKKDLLLNIFLGIIILYPNMIFLIIQDMNIPTYYIIYNILCCITVALICTFSTHKFNQLSATKRELETAELYNKTLNDLVDANKTFKHDMNNVVQAIGGYAQLNDMNGLKEYINNGLILEINKINNLSSINPSIINSPPIFSLLLSKYNIAISKDIKVSIASFFDYTNINMHIYDFTKILGILLDNAINASSQCTIKEIDIHISIDFYNRNQIFKIKNTYINKGLDIHKFFEKGFSTKKEKSGIGLWEATNILKKYNNVKLFTTTKDNYFTQKLKINF
ncbi:MAG: GHKL domain-containing protein [Clostridia bacterium]|nr:GHKL domain-containing protein [Clostridia bacterium]